MVFIPLKPFISMLRINKLIFPSQTHKGNVFYVNRNPKKKNSKNRQKRNNSDCDYKFRTY